MRTIGRWFCNGWSVFFGSILWLMGRGGFYHCLECSRCGMEVEDADEAVARHDAFFHGDES